MFIKQIKNYINQVLSLFCNKNIKKEDATCISDFLVKHRIGNSFWPPGTLHTMDITVRAFFTKGGSFDC